MSEVERLRVGYWLLTKRGKAQIYVVWLDGSVTVEFKDKTTRIIGPYAAQRYRHLWRQRKK